MCLVVDILYMGPCMDRHACILCACVLFLCEHQFFACVYMPVHYKMYVCDKSMIT